MKGWKAIASAAGMIILTIVLIVVAVVVVVTGIKGARRGEVPPPDRYLKQLVARIDSESFELITKSRREWRKVKAKKGDVWKNPDTGKYTIVDLIVCVECGEKIPGPLQMVHMKYLKDAEAKRKFLAERDSYKCPKCGKPAIGPPPLPGL